MEWTIIFLNLMYAVIGVVLMFVSYKVFDLLSPKINFEEELKKGFLQNPQVSVEITLFRPYYILGEVRAPGSYPFKEGLNVLNAVAIAGGFTYRAENEKVKIVRPGAEEQKLLATGVYTPVFPGDTIYVEEKIF